MAHAYGNKVKRIRCAARGSPNTTGNAIAQRLHAQPPEPCLFIPMGMVEAFGLLRTECLPFRTFGGLFPVARVFCFHSSPLYHKALVGSIGSLFLKQGYQVSLGTAAREHRDE
jgi:hypothetical protein